MLWWPTRNESDIQLPVIPGNREGEGKSDVWVSKNFFRKWTFINVQKSI